MKRHNRKILKENIQTIVTYQIKKLSTNNLVYYGKCPNQACAEDYIGESDRRIKDIIIDCNKCDKNSHTLKHFRQEVYSHVLDKNLKVFCKIYRSAIKRKISEALFIKQLELSFNVKKIIDSVTPLK